MLDLSMFIIGSLRFVYGFQRMIFEELCEYFVLIDKGLQEFLSVNKLFMKFGFLVVGWDEICKEVIWRSINLLSGVNFKLCIMFIMSLYLRKCENK